MNCLRRLSKTMRSAPSLIAVTVFCTAFILISVRQARAQDADPPDIRMLLNLDLFRSQPQTAAGTQGANPASNDSTLDQIRTLNALGYLGNGDNAGARNTDSVSVNPTRPAPPLFQGSPE
jgi:hypothetical protein